MLENFKQIEVEVEVGTELKLFSSVGALRCYNVDELLEVIVSLRISKRETPPVNHFHPLDLCTRRGQHKMTFSSSYFFFCVRLMSVGISELLGGDMETLEGR
jgi:hypothetical protein